jgi:hypothetical protein
VNGVSEEMAAQLEDAAKEAEQQLENERRTLMKQMSLLESELQVTVKFPPEIFLPPDFDRARKLQCEFEGNANGTGKSWLRNRRMSVAAGGG